MQRATNDHHRLRVLDLALANAQGVRRVIRETANFGDLHNQLARAAISVVSNISEGDGLGSERARRACFARARGSNLELQWQLRLLLDEAPEHPLHDAVDRVGRMLTRLIGRVG